MHSKENVMDATGQARDLFRGAERQAAADFGIEISERILPIGEPVGQARVIESGSGRSGAITIHSVTTIPREDSRPVSTPASSSPGEGICRGSISHSRSRHSSATIWPAPRSIILPSPRNPSPEPG
jgi:hypothetical protein